MGSLKILLLIILIPGLALGQDIKSTFFSRCEKFKELDCQKLWDIFEQAHMNKDPCNVSVETYDPLIAAVSCETPELNKAILWSLTMPLVQSLKKSRPECFQPCVPMSLQSVLDGLTWCGKEGKNDTFTTTRELKDKGIIKCDTAWDNPHAPNSLKYAKDAKGNVTALLSGSSNPPFNPEGIFPCVEVPNLNYPKVEWLNVVIVSGSKSNCGHKSLNELWGKLDRRIKHTCKEVPESWIDKCIDKKTTCADCFSGSWVMRPSVLSFIVLCFLFMF